MVAPLLRVQPMQEFGGLGVETLVIQSAPFERFGATLKLSAGQRPIFAQSLNLPPKRGRPEAAEEGEAENHC